MHSVNQAAVAMIKEAIARADAYNMIVTRAACGATLVDMGLHCVGGWEAGRVFVEAGLGGLGRATYGAFPLGNSTLPSINVWVDNPVLATVASQAGDWKLSDGEFAAIGSGPARAIAHQDQWSGHANYTDRADEVVIQLQTNRVPDEAVCLRVAEACGVKPENVYVVFAPTGCLVGSIQVASRTVEQVMVKLLVHGYDTLRDTVRAGFGVAPVAPVAADEGEAMGRVNDCLIYGGSTLLYVDAEDTAIERVIGELCFDVHAGELWGLPFAKIFERFGRNWFQVPHLVDSPARVLMNNLRTGRTFAGGQINEEVLRKSLLQ